MWFSRVRWTRHISGEAPRSSFSVLFCARIWRITRSFSGWFTLSTRPCSSFSLNSLTTQLSVRPSMDIPRFLRIFFRK